jgi:hypothetical protein
MSWENLKGESMDILIWLNTVFLIFAAVAEGIILYVVLQGAQRK